MIRLVPVTFVVVTLIASAGCSILGRSDDSRPSAAAIEAVAAASVGDHRSDSNIARNAYRHPVETLSFLGLEPDMSVIEVWPGGLWYTEILAPVLKANGRYIAASYDASRPGQPDYVARSHQGLIERFANERDVYGDLELAILHPPTIQLGADESVDMLLTFRSTHGMVNGGYAEDAYAAFFAVLKPGGVLGVVQHRAGPANDGTKFTGYLPQEKVVALAEGAGFVLEASSEVNANPNDPTDYEKGVWTLPPTLRLGDTDREKYLAIGESDRMTLRFRKP